MKKSSNTRKMKWSMWKSLACYVGALPLITGCANMAPDKNAADRAMSAIMRGQPTPSRLSLPPKSADAPANANAQNGGGIDLLVHNADVKEVFTALVAETPYSIAIHPNVSGKVSLSLHNTTLKKALDVLREVYGYDYQIDGQQVSIYPATIQTRIFTVSYPKNQRSGESDLSITSGGQSGQQSGGGSAMGGSGAAGNTAVDSQRSKLSTRYEADFWKDLETSLKMIVGTGEDRKVVVSPMSGVVAIKAMPEELKQVTRFLQEMQASVSRQVLIEAKIVEVGLSEGSQNGIDWSNLNHFVDGASAFGFYGGSSQNSLAPGGGNTSTPTFGGGSASGINPISAPGAVGGLFGFALRARGFQGIIGFLESHGSVQVLSSPRIATLNNQKALLKVGNDDYFVTNISGSSSTAVPGTTTTASSIPNIQLTPFFSGVALDITPQVDSSDTIMLHIRPSVSNVTESTKIVDLGQGGNYKLPVASTSVNESDTMVRLKDGQIVAIGGLMQVTSMDGSAGLPGVQDTPIFKYIFGNKTRSFKKKEVVVLLRPIIIRGAMDWDKETRKVQDRLDLYTNDKHRVIKLDDRMENDQTTRPIKK